MRSASVASDALSTAPTRGVLPQQVGEFFERGFLVVYRENDQAAGAVVTVHDLLILHVRYASRGDRVIFASGSADHGDCETA